MGKKRKKAPEPVARRPIKGLWPLLAVVSGTLWFLSCADFDIWVFAWIAMVPSIVIVERAETRRRAVFWTWIAGIIANAGGFYWITGLLVRFAHLPWPVAILLWLMLCAYQAITFALFAFVVRTIRGHHTLPMALVAPVVMVAFELIVPFIFPWYLAITQAWNPHVIQVADLTGPLGVSALLLMVNGAVYDLLTERKKRLVPAAVSLAIVVAAWIYGDVRLRQVDARRAAAPKVEVGLVQPNVSFDMKGVEHPHYRDEQLADLHRLSAELEREGAELIIWTESSYPFAIHRRAVSDFPEGDRRRVRRGFTVPLLFGAVTDAEEDPYPHNTALMLDEEGRITATFDKIFLLMFGEYIPGLETFPWIRNWLPKEAGHFARGKKIEVFPFRQWRLGPMICYEDILPAFGRKLGKLHPHLLVNITNDAWFGDTSEPWEHLALSVYRSVELRTDLVRAVNTGVSAIVDAGGRVVRKTYAVDPKKDPRGADKLLGQVAMMEGGHTVYAVIGDVFGILNLAAMAALWLVVPWWRKRRATTSGRSDGG